MSGRSSSGLQSLVEIIREHQGGGVTENLPGEMVLNGCREFKIYNRGIRMAI